MELVHLKGYYCDKWSGGLFAGSQGCVIDIGKEECNMKKEQNISAACRSGAMILCTVACLCLMWSGMRYMALTVCAENSQENEDGVEQSAADIGDSNELSEVMETVDGLALRTGEDEVFLEKEGISFSGPADNDDLLSSVISGIVVSGTDSDYCIYGVCPGDTQEDIEQTGFDGGGSGEMIDPAGRVLTFYYSSDPENPRIILN